jgi:hypothetical protein
VGLTGSGGRCISCEVRSYHRQRRPRLTGAWGSWPADRARRGGKPRAETVVLVRRSSTVTYRARAEPGKPPAIISDRVSSIIDYPHSVPGEGERSCYSRVLHSERRRPVTGNTTWRGRSDLLGWHICSPKFASIRSFGIGRRMGTVKSAPSTLLRFMLNSTTNGGRLRHLCDVSLGNNVYFFESSRIYQYIHSRNFRG